MAETGHQPNRVFIDQDGNFNLNGASFYNDADVDISGQLESAVGATAAGMKLAFGRIQNSSIALSTIDTGLTQIYAAWASVVSSATLSTAAGVAAFCTVAFSTSAGSTMNILAHRYSATANEAIAATSTGSVITWGAIGAA